MKVVIITGASSGLGKEFVSLLDQQENIDQIWLVARRQDLMEEISRNLKHDCRIFSLDLCKEESFDVIEAALKEKEGTEISYLINSAGFGKIGNYKQVSIKTNTSMVDLNCRACLAITSIALSYMPNGGNIIQVASVAAFLPMEGMSVYSASKAFVYRYSNALRWELKGTKIKISTLCPFWIKDTEFIPVSKSDLNGEKTNVKNFAFASKAKTVAKRALKANKRGKAVITPGFVPTLIRFLCKVFPAFIVIPAWKLWRKL